MVFSFIELLSQLGVLIFERVVVRHVGFDLVVQFLHISFEFFVFHLQVRCGAWGGVGGGASSWLDCFEFIFEVFCCSGNFLKFFASFDFDFSEIILELFFGYVEFFLLGFYSESKLIFLWLQCADFLSEFLNGVLVGLFLAFEVLHVGAVVLFLLDELDDFFLCLFEEKLFVGDVLLQ